MKEVEEWAPHDLLGQKGESSLLAETIHQLVFPDLLSGIKQAVKPLHRLPITHIASCSHASGMS